MAYSLSERFAPPSKPYFLLDPGAYQNPNPPVMRMNKAPFLTKSARNSGIRNRIWTDVQYNIDVRSKIIPNCTSLMSKVPRFPYEALSKEDIEKILCQCGIENPCECLVEEYKEEISCQGKVQRTLFKGPSPRPTLGEGLSVPSKKDHGFNISPDGTKIRILENVKKDSPPFYDTRVNESTAFYQGCKWSKWTSQRDQTHLGVTPGPADYTIENDPSYEAVCAEKVRALKRKMSKQYRFIEMVQLRNVLEGRPGPSDYTPNYPKGTDIKCLGPKAKRFTIDKYNKKPGPAEYSVKRDFDKVEPPQKPCQAKLPAPAFFGVKAVRFKSRHEEGPCPASYNIFHSSKPLRFCNYAPFGSSTQRFKEQIIIEDDDTEDELIESIPKEAPGRCPAPTWVFKSKTKRMELLLKKFNEPSPADLPQPNIEVMRSAQLQYNCPFFSSEGRFRPWYNWISVHGKERTPGPAYYCLDKPKCIPAVISGPTYRSRRFTDTDNQTPAPNTYDVDGGIESVLTTHNQKLKDNITKKHAFHWSPHEEPKKLSLDAQETILLNKTIALLDVNDIFEYRKSKVIKKSSSSKYSPKESKLLRCFLQSHPMSRSF